METIGNHGIPIHSWEYMDPIPPMEIHGTSMEIHRAPWTHMNKRHHARGSMQQERHLQEARREKPDKEALTGGPYKSSVHESPYNKEAPHKRALDKMPLQYAPYNRLPPPHTKGKAVAREPDKRSPTRRHRQEGPCKSSIQEAPIQEAPCKGPMQEAPYNRTFSRGTLH